MLEEVVRQLSHDLSVAEKAVGSSQAQADADTALRALPAAEREVKALNARVSCSCLDLSQGIKPGQTLGTHAEAIDSIRQFGL